MKARLNDKQTDALREFFGICGAGDGDTRTYDIDFQHRISDSSGESTQIAINGRWLHRDGTWHDKPEPPSPRWFIRRDDHPMPFFREYVQGRIRWTERPEDAEWFASPELAHEFLRTDEGLQGIADVWTHIDEG